VITDIRKKLDRIATTLDECQASLERPKDGNDAEQILHLLDDLRMTSRQALDEWCDEQWRVFPETKP
jgi:hypothetical protein